MLIELPLRVGRRAPWTTILTGAVLAFLVVLSVGPPAPSPRMDRSRHGGVKRPGEKATAAHDSWRLHEQPPPGHFQANVAIWQKLQPLLGRYEPIVTPPLVENEYFDFTLFSENIEDYMDDRTMMDARDILQMRIKHEGFVRDMKQTFGSYEPPSGAARRGVVSTAAEWYLPVFMVSLRMLRRSGSTLPVELVMHTREEYEEEICERVLPAMNAKCIVIEDIIVEGGMTFRPHKKLGSFQLKVLALLFSSFTEVLFIDADDMALHEPEELFDSEPFRSHGLVTWPDFWVNTASPVYYLINGGEPENKGNRSATESGQIMFNKATHFQVLILAAYYNYWGPDLYYGILCQTGPGRGDKETWLPAAISLGKPFYQVRQPVDMVGHEKFTEPGMWIFGMLQYDPVQDYYRHSGNRTRLSIEDLRDFGMDDGPPRSYAEEFAQNGDVKDDTFIYRRNKPPLPAPPLRGRDDHDDDGHVQPTGDALDTFRGPDAAVANTFNTSVNASDASLRFLDSYPETAPPRAFFLHCNMPKWNAADVFNHGGPWDLTRNEAGGTVLAYTHPPWVVARIAGVERKIWEELRWVACTLETKLSDWRQETDVCANVEAHWQDFLDVEFGVWAEGEEQDEGEDATGESEG